jgi:glycosyltransferase involved in cell wall biosynthesis
VIHTHLNPAGWYTALVCPKDIPQVHTLHISYSDDTDSRKSLVRLERNLLLERKDKNFITLSPRLREDLLQCVNIKGEVYVLSNFIQDSFFEPTPVKPPHSRHFRMVAIGNIRPQKNYDYLLDVFSHLKDSNISVDIYGYGDPARLRERAERENIPVHFKGPAKDSRDIYWRYDAFIMPSKFEGFGLSAYEAMASEVPAILSDLEAFSSLIGDNALYIPLDDARASADIIRGAAENRGALIARAAKAKAYTSATVTRDKYVSSLMSIYEDIAAKNRIREK